jgi:hypothetical protein
VYVVNTHLFGTFALASLVAGRCTTGLVTLRIARLGGFVTLPELRIFLETNKRVAFFVGVRSCSDCGETNEDKDDVGEVHGEASRELRWR